MQSIVMTWIVPGIGKTIDQANRPCDRQPRDIKPSEILAWLNAVAANNSKSLVKKCVTHVRAIFDLCVDDELIVKNPARATSVKPAKGREADQTFLEPKQIRALLQAAVQSSQRDYLIVRVLLVCALRPGELFALRVNDVQQGKLMIDEAAVLGEISGTKTTESHGPVPLPPILQTELLAFIEAEGIADKPDALLFPSEVGTAMSHDNYLERKLRKFGIMAKIPRLNFQILRRTTATQFQNFGQVKDTQGLLRHKDAATTLNNYQKVISKNLADASAAWDKSISVKRKGGKK